jgi:hypothetical protein
LTVALTYEFCDARAQEAATAAAEASLDNVRERALRSEAAWREMAHRIQNVRDSRNAVRPDHAADQAPA